MFDDRHRVSLIDSEQYLLQCQLYVELNPVRAKMVLYPAQYDWSSYQHNGLGKPISCLTPHPLYHGSGLTNGA
ncbi:hypothetical protein [Arsukibacterium indicum]|uniref:Transposase n=1 Tax=Arsukibacterium indicum TaxID=2848612 RepID=A0ABS6MHK3_9GAMM|nr:hypothetical protein [Arsukibacterium indicum]MBV2128273.1 hypothetical protein [Arsukibacterium indicum]